MPRVDLSEKVYLFGKVNRLRGGIDMSINIHELIHLGNELLDSSCGEHSRHKSWVHCHEAFSRHIGKPPSEDEADSLALHLTAYLASWGMYRGSSFLLRNTDYQVHTPVVKMLCRNEYALLRNTYSPENLDLLFQLRDEMKQYYIEQRKKLEEEWSGEELSDTLITKILLGTLGCTPAYDTYACMALVDLRLVGSFGKNSLKNIYGYYKENRNEFDALRAKASEMDGITEYPPMKVLDLCLWGYGYSLEKKRSAAKKGGGSDA